MNTYDVVPYPAGAHFQTHPDHLRAIGILLGMKPEPMAGARVLEIGCANGANLFPMAELYADTQFVGLDYSEVQIAAAKATQKTMGLGNIAFYQADVSNLENTVVNQLGSFDYILCHGVFSWVDERVRSAILKLIQNHLQPMGIGFISYNCYPGWKMREVARDMMLYHGDQFTDPKMRFAQARAMLEFVVGQRQGASDIYGRLLQETVEVFNTQDPNYVFHDQLEKTNVPFYFHEFASLALENKLQYLGEAIFSEMFAYGLSPEAEASLVKIAGNDLIKREQYLDFVRNRFFRSSLVVHQDVSLQRNIPLDRCRDVVFLGACQRTDDLTSTHKATYLAGNQTINANSPMAVRSIDFILSRSPAAVSMAEVIAELTDGQQRDEAGSGVLSNEVAETLLKCLSMGGVVARTESIPVPKAAVATDLPYALQYSRLISASHEVVANALHNNVKLLPLQRIVLQLCSGQQTIEAITNEVMVLFEKGQLLWTPKASNNIADTTTESEPLVEKNEFEVQNVIHVESNVADSTAPI